MINASSTKRKTIIAILISSAFLTILNQTLLANAIPHVMEDLNITENMAQWLTTIFMLVNGIMIPITAFLSNKFETRRLLVTTMSLFLLGTIIAAIAQDFTVLIIGRIIQSMGSGVIMPVVQIILLSMFPIEKRGAALGMIGLVISFAPAIGPSLSGFILEFLSWRALFYVIIPIAIINILVIHFLMENVIKKTNPKLDIVSIIFSSIGFGGLLYGFSIAGTYGWTNLNVISILSLGTLSLIIFILRQLKLEEPMLEFRVFKKPIFALATIIGVLVFVLMISAEIVLPIYIQNMLGHTAFKSGLVLLPGAIIVGIMSPITGKVFDMIGARILATIGISILFVTTIIFTNLSLTTTITFLTILYAIRLFGISLIMMPAQTAAINSLSKSLIPHGTAIYNTMTQSFGSIGTAIFVTIMVNTSFNADGSKTLESMVSGVNNTFIVASVIAIIALILSFFLKGTNPRLLKKIEE